MWDRTERGGLRNRVYTITFEKKIAHATNYTKTTTRRGPHTNLVQELERLVHRLGRRLVLLQRRHHHLVHHVRDDVGGHGDDAVATEQHELRAGLVVPRIEEEVLAGQLLEGRDARDVARGLLDAWVGGCFGGGLGLVACVVESYRPYVLTTLHTSPHTPIAQRTDDALVFLGRLRGRLRLDVHARAARHVVQDAGEVDGVGHEPEVLHEALLRGLDVVGGHHQAVLVFSLVGWGGGDWGGLSGWSLSRVVDVAMQ